MIVFAHRGASAFAPENTKASFKKAIDLGAKNFEFDLQITSDNEYVIFHDYTLERTSNGQGLLSNKTLSELMLNTIEYEFLDLNTDVFEADVISYNNKIEVKVKRRN